MNRKLTPPMANFTVGPFFPPHLIEPGCNDLTRVGKNIAKGQNILLGGCVTDSDRKPAVNVIVEIWQADTNGIFRHPSDPRFAEADPGFFGWGRCFTDQHGQYCFLTVMPGTSDADVGGPRCPHINIMLLGSGIMRRLVTTVFFGDTAETVDDPVLKCVSELATRRRLFAIRDPTLDSARAQGFRFDIVLRGERPPFFLV